MFGLHTPGRVVFAALLTMAFVAGPAAQAPRQEVAVKADFVLRFPEFVEWPMTEPNGRPVSLCLSPSHPFGPNVQASVMGQPRGRRIIVRELKDSEPVRACDVVYVAPADLSLLDTVADLPILTVGDQPDFCQRGGMINLLVIDGRVRFEIDLSRARRSGLKMDSQLLRLASKVFGGMR
ncbi:MAG TPA: YfiR family protein [Vicinamibacterales bacterium]|nr:YfiR family protein [Vicinamibacterales bacterium]